MPSSQRNLNVFYFLIYSVLGWIFELIYCFIVDGELVNRGFLHGPYLPIYGFGAIIIINLIAPYVNKSILGLFTASLLICTGLEYFISWYMETTFNVLLWDYSDYYLNFNGRVCLWNSTLFGLLAIAVIYIFQPFFTKHLLKIPEKIRPTLSVLIVAGLVIDFLFIAIPMLKDARVHTEILRLFS